MGLSLSGEVIERLVLGAEFLDPLTVTAVTGGRGFDIRVHRSTAVTDKKPECWHGHRLGMVTDTGIGAQCSLGRCRSVVCDRGGRATAARAGGQTGNPSRDSK